MSYFLLDQEIKTHLKSYYDTSIQNLFLGMDTTEKEIDTTEKEMDTTRQGDTTENEMEANHSDGETTEEEMAIEYDQLTEEQDMDTFDENECVITHDVFMGYSEAEKLQFIMEDQLCIHDDTISCDDYVEFRNTWIQLDYYDKNTLGNELLATYGF